jgi:hypothetical protein
MTHGLGHPDRHRYLVPFFFPRQNFYQGDSSVRTWDVYPWREGALSGRLLHAMTGRWRSCCDNTDEKLRRESHFGLAPPS